MNTYAQLSNQNQLFAWQDKVIHFIARTGIKIQDCFKPCVANPAGNQLYLILLKHLEKYHLNTQDIIFDFF